MQTSMTFSWFSRTLGTGVFSETKGKLFLLKLIHHSACGAEPFAPAPLNMKPLPPFETLVITNQGTEHNIFNTILWKQNLAALWPCEADCRSAGQKFSASLCKRNVCLSVTVLPLHCSNVRIITAVFTFTDNFAHLLNVGSFPDETDRTAMVSGSVL